MIIGGLIILVILFTGGLPTIYYCFSHKPKIELSPSAFRLKMEELEAGKSSEIESAKSLVAIDDIIDKYDAEVARYKIRR